MKHTAIPRLSWPWIVLLLAMPYARGERLPVRIFTSADGLGNSFVDHLMRDARGFMWFSTRDGLSRFDGARFITYRIGDKNASSGIESLYQTRDGAYWITTTTGLYRFKDDIVSQVGETIGDRPLLNTEFISGGRGPLLEDRNGALWYASNDLYKVKESNGKFVFEKLNLNVPPSPNRTFGAFQILEAPDGCLWLNTSQGVLRRFPDGRVVLYHWETAVRTGLASMVIEPGGRAGIPSFGGIPNCFNSRSGVEGWQ